MRSTIFAFATALAASMLVALPSGAAGKPKPNPADYPLKVRVVVSRMDDTERVGSYQVLGAYVDGKYVVLKSILTTAGPLVLGEYAGQVSDPHGHPHAYDLIEMYDLLFPDGTTRTYTVKGLGVAPTANP